MGDEPDRRRLDPLVAVRLAPGPYFVGQAVELVVTLVYRETSDLPMVAPPHLPRADLVALDSGRGDPAGDDSAVVARFLLVPRQVGTLTIPPFRVRLGDRVGSSSSTSLTVANIPIAGRSAAFLGGVGPFRVMSHVEPSTVRVGQPVEFWITMTGPAAWGSVASLDLAAWSASSGAFVVRESSNQLDSSNPPTRTFRYRLQPRRAGRVVLPPVALAAFDPRSRTYATQYTASLNVSVEPPPRFDPARVDFGPASRSDPRRLAIGWLTLITVALVGGGVLAVVARRRWHRWRHDRPVDWHGDAVRLAQWADTDRGRVEVAEAVADRLTRTFERVTGQRVAVLTPPEAEAVAEAITRDVELSRRVGRLVAECDGIRFDPETNPTAGDRGELVAEAVAVFQAIGRQARGNRPQLGPIGRPGSRDGP